MNEPVQPVTLLDLLRALARSDDLRSLARECGLSVRELRRRLDRWSREMEREVGKTQRPEDPLPAPPKPPAQEPAISWPVLAATSLAQYWTTVV